MAINNDYAEQGTYLSKEDREKRLSGDGLSGIENKLIAYAGVKSPEEIAEITGVPATEVAQRTLRILSSVDYFSIQQKRNLMMYQLQSLVTEIYLRRESISDRNIGSALNSAGGNIQRVLATLKEMEAHDAAGIKAQEDAYAQKLLLIVQRAFDRLLGALDQKYPEVEAKDLAEAFQKNILLLSREMDLELSA